jgi:hypothetical protein
MKMLSKIGRAVGGRVKMTAPVVRMKMRRIGHAADGHGMMTRIKARFTPVDRH